MSQATTLRIAVIGGGAIGGLLASRLEGAGFPVTLIARGAHLAAIQADGLTVVEDGVASTTRPHATDNPAACGTQDFVFICLKGPALVAAAASFAPLVGPHTRIVSVMNGVPWWFMQGLGEHGSKRIESVDPDGTVSRVLPPKQCYGCVVHLASSIQKPGVVVRRTGNHLIVGAANGDEQDEGVREITRILAAAAFDTAVAARIQHDVWAKLWGNITMNPISALTGATADVILDDPLTLALVVAVMDEARAVGEKLGIALNMSTPERNAQTRKLGAFKTSMLQDVEAQRPLEIDAIVTAPREIARMVGVNTPFIDVLCGLIRQKGRTMGLYA